MILRRLALFLGLLFGLAATQLPEIVEQYRQRLGGAIDELSAVVARFDSDSGQQGLTESGGIDRLHANPDRFVQKRGDEIQDDVARLQRLRDAQVAFAGEGAFARLGTFATHYDGRIAHGAWSDFEPAVPTSAEALGIGLVAFLVGGGVVHAVGRPLRGKRRQRLADVEPVV
jgi:hypothetical protein